MPLDSFDKQSVTVGDATVTGPPPLDFTVEKQGLDGVFYDNWCWASVAAGVSNFLDASGVSQCSVATATLKKLQIDCDCCNSGNKQTCDRYSELEISLSLNFNLRQAVMTMLPGTQIQAETEGTGPSGIRVPVCMRVSWAEGGSHYIGIAGANPHADGNIYFTITDPIYGSSSFSEAAMKSGQYIVDPPDGTTLHGSWDQTFLLRKNPQA